MLSQKSKCVNRGARAFTVKKFLAFLAIFCAALPRVFCAGAKCERRAIEIWKGVKGVKGGAQSVMFMSRPENANGTAVVICPGGSYHHLGMLGEGHCAARWFNSIGVSTFVLRYRVAQGGFHYPAQLQDIQRAITLLREKSSEWGIDPGKIGAIGFSAGGHLVTMAGAFARECDTLGPLGIKTSESARPDFIMPIYPVVSMRDDIANKWSRKSLLGKDFSQEHIEKFSMEKQIPRDMPPAYIVACEDDPVVMFVNSELLSRALEAQKIPLRFVSYPWGGHGFGMLDNKFMKTFRWNESLKSWLIEQGFID